MASLISSCLFSATSESCTVTITGGWTSGQMIRRLRSGLRGCSRYMHRWAGTAMKPERIFARVPTRIRPDRESALPLCRLLL